MKSTFNTFLIMAIIILLCPVVSLASASLQFDEHTRVQVKLRANGIAAGDLTNDGILDIVIPSYDEDICIIIGDGTGSFGIPSFYNGGYRENARPLLADFNKDGYLDAAICNNDGSSFTLLLGNGSGSLSSHYSGSTSSYPNITMGDFNNDGYIDVASSSWLGNRLTVFLNQGNGTFNSQSCKLSAGSFGIAAGDFNGDGKTDLAVTLYYSRQIVQFWGNGDGTFTQGNSIVVVNNGKPGQAYAGDFNNDGVDDLTLHVAPDGEPNFIASYLGTQGGELIFKQSFIQNGYIPCLGDVDGDGILDIVASESNTKNVHVFAGNGDGSFTQAFTYTYTDTGFNACGQVEIGDFDNDGSNDIAVCLSTGDTTNDYVSILLNKTSSTSTPNLALTSPNGSENWTAGTTHDIMWTSTNVTNVKIEYSTNSGSSWSTIIASTSASVGSYSWLVPIQPSANCKVRILDASNETLSDVSSSTFSITELVLSRTLVFEENFDSNTNWQFNNDYSNPNFSSCPGINGWENGPMSGAEHPQNAYLNITDGIVWGCSAGYGTNPQSFEPTSIHREISVDSAGFEVEFRAISQSGWPNQVQVTLMSDWVKGENPHYYGFVIYGESSNHTIDIRSDFGDWYYRKYVGSIVNSWHTYKFARLSDGSWELYIDDNKYADFTPNPDLTYTKFNRIGISTLRQGSKIDWVKVYELADSTATISQSLEIISPESVLPGDSSRVEIKAQNVQNLFGASFVLNYTNGEFIKMVSPEAGDFLGDDILFYPEVDMEASKVSVGLSRKAGQGEVDGSGVLMRVRFTSGPDTPYGTVVLFSLSEITANDEDGTPLSLRGVGNATTITLTLPVWPGDTNNDELVDQTDVLPIGTYWAKTGPARPDGSYQWEAQVCQSWYPEEATYADATGDGIVNQRDVLPIGLNWSKTRTAPKIVALKAVNASGTIKPFTLFEPPLNAGEEFWVEIQVENISSLFGLSFVLTYDNSEFIEPMWAESGTFMGDDVVFFPNIDKNADEVAVGITRKAGQGGVDGSGSVVKIKLKMLQNFEDGSVITFFLNDVVANDQSGAGINLTIEDGQIGVGVLDELSTLPRKFSLSHNYPNPFNPMTSIEFAVPAGKSEHVRLNIYDLRGALVRTLINELSNPGFHSVIWDGTDETGNKVSSGIYIYQLQAGEFTKSNKMMLMR